MEAVGSPVEVDVSHVKGLGKTKVIMVVPLTAEEYQVLKAHPELRGLSAEDKVEAMGLRMIYEMMAKCDDSLIYEKFKQLPLTLIGELTTAILSATGVLGGGGALGEL